jgi:hypothetical protein
MLRAVVAEDEPEALQLFALGVSHSNARNNKPAKMFVMIVATISQIRYLMIPAYGSLFLDSI